MIAPRHYWLTRLGILTVAISVGLGSFGLYAPSPVYAAGASLKISPNTGTYEVGSLVDVSFIVDTGGESINAVGADILFPPDKLQVVNPAASTSFISIWVSAPTYSNTDGTINLQGGLPNPGIKTSAGVISTVTFRVKSAGKAALRFAPSSKVLRNDGDGTNILTSSSPAELTLKNPPPAGPPANSPTHPDSNLWYNSSQIQFTWEPVDQATGYSFIFDQNPKTVPDETSETTDTSTTIKALADGIWYFHLRSKTEIWGGTTSVTVRVDSSPPAAFVPTFDKNLLTTEESAGLRFITTDGASGIDHYEVKQFTRRGGAPSSETLFVEATSPYTISPLPAGGYEFVVRAFDRAGNEADGTTNLEVVAGGIPFYARVPFLRNPAVANGALIVLAVGIIILLTTLIIRRVRIRSTFRHDLEVLEKDARKKAVVLERELSELRKAQQMFQSQTAPAIPTPPPSAPPPSPTTPPPAPSGTSLPMKP